MAAMPEHAQALPTRRVVLRAWIFEAFQAIAVILVYPPVFWMGPDFRALPDCCLEFYNLELLRAELPELGDVLSEKPILTIAMPFT